MRIYLDVSCLNRPFDDQSQLRVRLEAEAIAVIMALIDSGRWRQFSSAMAEIEIAAMKDFERQRRVRVLLPKASDRIKLSPVVMRRASQLMALGFHAADAMHLAAAEIVKADVFLSCDDKLCSAALRQRKELKVAVANPLAWLKEQSDATNT